MTVYLEFYVFLPIVIMNKEISKNVDHQHMHSAQCAKQNKKYKQSRSFHLISPSNLKQKNAKTRISTINFSHFNSVKIRQCQRQDCHHCYYCCCCCCDCYCVSIRKKLQSQKNKKNSTKNRLLLTNVYLMVHIYKGLRYGMVSYTVTVTPICKLQQ